MWIDDIEPRSNAYDDTEDNVTLAPYTEADEFDIQVLSTIQCENAHAARHIAEYLRQFDIHSVVCIDGTAVIYRS